MESMSLHSTPRTHSFFALAGVQLDFDSIDLGQGVTLSRTYIHVMAHPVAAFAPAGAGKHHPGPWRPLLMPKSSRPSAGLYAVLSVPYDKNFAKLHHNWASWITLLMRFSTDTTITMTLLSEQPFEEVSAGLVHAKLIERVPEVSEGATISEEVAVWLRDNWSNSLSLSKNESFMFAVGALYHSHRASEELGVVSVWGALERLFSTNAAELKYRVCTNIAAFLERPGKERYLLFGQLKKLGSWLEAEKALRRAQRWVFIGYSLPAADFEFKYLLKRVQLAREEIPEIIVLTKTKKPKKSTTIQSYRKLFGEGASPYSLKDSLPPRSRRFLGPDA